MVTGEQDGECRLSRPVLIVLLQYVDVAMSHFNSKLSDVVVDDDDDGF